MKAIALAGLVAVLLTSAVMADGVVTWNARAEVWDYSTFTLVDMGQPIDVEAYAPGSLWLHWTVSCVVTGDNMGLGGAVVSMGVKNTATDVLAPIVQDAGSLTYPAVYKAPGAVANGGIDAGASAGGPGAGKGASKGNPSASEFYIDQMGMGYLDWDGRRFQSLPPPPKWVGEQQWGVGMESRKATILGVGDTYDLVDGYIALDGLAGLGGTYQSFFDLSVMSSKLIASGQNLATVLPSIVMEDVPAGSANLVGGASFEFTIVPEPATLLLLAGASLLYRRRRA